jgi:malonate-semialdehyde dehydrogenase (acetylating)/methylmalonate-semialdehyde dehydrogenase
VKPTFRSYQEEIFGPVLQMVRADSFEEAVRLPSEHQYGNGVAIFTRNGHAAREFAARVNVGHGRHQRADPGAGRLSHVRRAGSAAASATSTSTGPEGVRFWTEQEDHPALGATDRFTGENSFVIPTGGGGGVRGGCPWG